VSMWMWMSTTTTMMIPKADKILVQMNESQNKGVQPILEGSMLSCTFCGCYLFVILPGSTVLVLAVSIGDA
jgi:hypothetical protein